MRQFMGRKRGTGKRGYEGYYQMPKALFTDPKYRDISTEAKMLYAFMLDRQSLSRKNGWLDQDGNIYIIFTLQEAMELLSIGHEKAVKLFAMLNQERGVGLIRRRKLGQGRPAMIYVNDIEGSDSPENDQNSGKLENRSQDIRKRDCNNTENNKTNINNQSIYPDDRKEGHMRLPCGVEDTSHYGEIVKSNIEQDVLMERHPYDRETIQGIIDLITDTVASRRKTIRLDCQDIPQELVKSRFLKLNFCHIEYILDCLSKNMTKIRNFKSYLLTVLYHAPSTIGGYYSAAMAYDMASGYA